MNDATVTAILKDVCIEKLKTEFFGELPEGYGAIKTVKNKETGKETIHVEKSFFEDKKCFETDEEFTLTNGVVVTGMKTKLEECIEVQRKELIDKFHDPKSAISEEGRNQIEQGGYLSAIYDILTGRTISKEELIDIIKNTPEFIVSTVEEMDDKIIEVGEEAAEKVQKVRDKIQGSGSSGDQGNTNPRVG